MKKNSIIALSLAAAAVFTVVAFAPAVVDAQILRGNLETLVTDGDEGLGLGTSSPVAIAGILIASLLGFLGIGAVVIIISAGLRWMTAQGNSDTIDKSKKQLQWAAIGLLVILSSYAITNTILVQIETATDQQEIRGTSEDE